MFRSLCKLFHRTLNSAKSARNSRRTRQAPARPKPKVVLRLDLLETRLVPSATVATDKPSYTPGSTALINASGFQAGETVQFQVVNQSNGNVYTPWSVTDGSAADADGTINGQVQTSWILVSDTLDSTLQLTATGLTSGEVATTTFADPNPNLNSFEDGSPPQQGTTGDWTNGNLTSGKAQYFEGTSVPFEAVFTGLTVNTSYTITITYDTTINDPSGAKHAFDYLTSYDFNNSFSSLYTGVTNWTTFADPINAANSGVPNPPLSGPLTLAIPLDPNINPNPPLTNQNMLTGHSQIGGQVFSLWGTTSFSIANSNVNNGYTISSGSYT